MYKLTLALLVLIVSCKSSDTFTTKTGVKFKLIHTNKEGIVAPMISTVKVIPNTKTDSIHSHLPLYKMVMPPAPYLSDPLAEVLITGVREGDSLVIFDEKGGQISYKIVKLFIPGYKKMNADSLIEVDKQKEIALMTEEQIGYGLSRIEHFVKINNPNAVKYEDAYAEILDKGVPPLADSGSRVAIKYSLRELQSGKVLSSNPIYEYVVSARQMYKPVDRIMHQLGKGGKARVYMPAVISLGDKANNPTTDLTKDVVFDIEVVSVK